MSDLLTITEVSRRSGVASSALRFYEARGLIRSERAGSGHRRYPRAVLRRLAFVVFAQRIGLSLEEIAGELAALPANSVPERADWARISGRWTRRVDERIAELQRLRAGLTTCIGRSEEHTSELQSHSDLVCRLLLEKKKKIQKPTSTTTP